MNWGDVDEASERLDRAFDALSDDPKLYLWCQSELARIKAVRGERDAAHTLIDRVQAGLGEYSQDRNTLLVGYSNIGRAAEALGEYDRGLLAWRRYQDAPPLPVDEPIGLYHLGECHRGMGDSQTAREYYQRAVELRLATHDSRLAEQRLEELSA